MDLGSIFLILALLVLVGLFISRPLFEPYSAKADLSKAREEHERSALLAERDRILNALGELDFDHTLGKIPDEDYPQQRAVLLKQGVEVLRQLDALGVESADEEAEARMEAAIAARQTDAKHPEHYRAQPAPHNGRQQTVPHEVEATPIVLADDELEMLLANRRRVRQEKAAGFCPKCGGPLQKSDRFCPKCGAKMA